MTILALAPRDVRALVAGAVALVILVGASRGLPTWLSWRAAAVQSSADRSLELDRTLAAVRGVRTDLDSTEARMARFRDLGGALFVARKPHEAAVNLTAAIHEAARLSSVRIETIESGVDSTAGAMLLRIHADVQAAGDITGLASLLERLEGHRALLALRRLSVRPHSVATPRDAIETFDLRVTVEGLALVAPDSSEHQP